MRFWRAIGFVVAMASGSANADDTVDYVRDIKPVLKEHCYACHAALKQKSNLRLDTAASIKKGGEQGPALKPRDSAASRIVSAVTGNDGWRMPPEGEGTPLSKKQIGRLIAWIDQGAIAPVDEQPEPDPRAHWAFRQPSRPVLAQVEGPTWLRNPIDAFVASQRNDRGLASVQSAPKNILLRRVYLDLIGLPPSRDALHAFLNDDSPDAYDRVVDRLLSNPQYGERWGRHWMDVWRYSDWYGRRSRGDVRNSYPHIWRWRDWIVHSLNQDQSYAQMLREMIAADEIVPEDDDKIVATGYLIRSWYKLNYNTWMKDLVEHTGKAFLGLTLNCAMCHDHKYDPITQKEYFQFRAFFEPLELRQDRVAGLPDPGPYNGYVYGSSMKPIEAGLPRAFDKNLDAKTFMFILGDERNRFPDRPAVEPNVPASLLNSPLEIQTVDLPAVAWYPGVKPFVRNETVAEARNAIDAATAALDRSDSEHRLVHQAQLKAAKAHLRWAQTRIAAEEAKASGNASNHLKTLSSTASNAEREWNLRVAESRLSDDQQNLAVAKLKSDAKAAAAIKNAEQEVTKSEKAVKAARAAVAKESDQYSALGPSYPKQSTGRRRALANWIADKNNPLTPRVAVNHIWMRHFGSPLVSTVFDFGRNGKPPTHPKLLDWLAVELMENRWSMKHIHRLIVSSSAYRMQSTSSGLNGDIAANNERIDPENKFLWRMNPRRMEAEVVRDSILHASEQLDTTMGGQDIEFEHGEKVTRRSLYFSHHDEGRMPFLMLFDAADASECYQRTETIVPQQALAMANSTLARSRSRLIAGRLNQQYGDDDSYIRAAFEQLLIRSPYDAEFTACRGFLGKQTKLFQSEAFSKSGAKTAQRPSTKPSLRARESLVHALINHNDFVTVR